MTPARTSDQVDGKVPQHWDKITFGPLIQGAAWEMRAPHAPSYVGMLDGYLTIAFGASHFHLCIGPTQGPRHDPTAVEPAYRPAHNFHAVEVPGQNVLETKGAGRGISGVHPVDQNLGLIRVGAADEHRGGAARPAGLDQIETRDVGQGFGQRALLLALHLLAGDDRDAAPKVTFRRFAVTTTELRAMLFVGAASCADTRSHNANWVTAKTNEGTTSRFGSQLGKTGTPMTSRRP